MRYYLILLLIAALFGSTPSALDAAGPQLAHMVFFQLKDHSPDARERLIEACQKYLAGHEGTVYFSVGALAEDLNREVNDRNFDVALHLVFRDRATHDQYQTHERHLKFIEEYRDSWSKVRVFDSYLVPRRDSDSAEAPEGRDARRLPLPDPATSFAGLVRGTVVQLRDDGIVLEIGRVVRQWEHSKAPNAEALVGKQVLVDGVKNDFVVPFLRSLKVGDEVTLDVAHREGEKLTVLELTDEQRARLRE